MLTDDIGSATQMALNGATLDGNGYDIAVTNADDASSNYGVYGGSAGGTVKNATITGNTTATSEKGFRAVGGLNLTGDVVIEDCTLNGTYTINIQNSNSAATGDLIVTNSTLLGWTSYALGTGTATFTNCDFGEGNTGYKYLRAYSDTTLTDCDFIEGFKIDLTNGATITFDNCTYNGVVITSSNVTDILDDATNDAASVTVA